MRVAKIGLGFALALLAAVALSGCIFSTHGHGSGGTSVRHDSGGHPGGPPAGRGWKK